MWTLGLLYLAFKEGNIHGDLFQEGAKSPEELLKEHNTEEKKEGILTRIKKAIFG